MCKTTVWFEESMSVDIQDRMIRTGWDGYGCGSGETEGKRGREEGRERTGMMNYNDSFESDEGVHADDTAKGF